MEADRTLVVIAAAGRGTRFDSGVKLLADVGGRPCVCRVVETIEAGLGPHRQVVVVGHAAEQVRRALGEAPHRMFVHQPVPRGTGDVLRVALEAVPDERVEIVYFFCGDKPLLTARTVARFHELFLRNQPAMMFLTGRIEGDEQAVAASTQGRVIQTDGHVGEGHVLAIIERKQILAMRPDEERRFIAPDGATYAFSREELLGVRDINASTYAWQAPLLRRYVGELSDDNAQKEYLITDLVEIFQRHRQTVRVLPLLDPREGLGIDTAAQWHEIRRLAEHTPHPTPSASPHSISLHRPSRWLDWFDHHENHRSLFRELTRIYGPDRDFIRERVVLYRRLLRKYRDQYGDEPVAVFRAPARISFNPHSDHQGSFVLYGTHGREVLLAAGRRADRRFSVSNADASYRQYLEFDPAEEISRAAAAWQRGWFDYIEDPAVQYAVASRRDAKNQTSDRKSTLNYVLAAVLRLMHARPGRVDHGLNLVLYGDIPAGGGMSSSSAVVVSTALAVNDLFGLGFTREELVGLLGEGEWYVGTRGGSGDHAGMLLAGRGEMANIQFTPPFQYRQIRKVAFPGGCQVLLVNSGVRSEKSLEEKLLFNRGVFAYKFAFAELQRLLREHHHELGIPGQVVEETRCLADLNVERLSLAQIYRLLARLPQEVSLHDLQQRYGDKMSATARSFFGVEDPSQLHFTVPLRGAAMYGLARADRGRVQDRLLAAGDEASLREFGRLLTIAHDGDRLFERDASIGQMLAYRGHHLRLTDDAMSELIRRSADAHDPDAQLRRQPGFYGASVVELDFIVDLALGVGGVLGAGLMGAGGGGIVEVFARDGDDLRAAVEKTLDDGYFEPRHMTVQVDPWRSIAAASRVEG
ncbi:MAG: NTP transferase domain-containing protein [Verrucomicrobiae bacterium]|nr:NTP transferase domain-containing protein [Verrucomicrobiae bacterium]